MSARLAPRGNGPRRRGAQATISSVAPGAATAVTSRPDGRALLVAQLVVKQAEVQQERVAGADGGGAELRHVALDESQLDAGFARPLTRAPERLGDGVDPRDLPATLRQLDRPDPAAAAEVEHGPVGRLAPRLLALEQGADPFRRVGLPGDLLPRRQADLVQDPVAEAHLSTAGLFASTLFMARRLTARALAVIGGATHTATQVFRVFHAAVRADSRVVCHVLPSGSVNALTKQTRRM